ncbi:MAG: hypothetical protein Q7R30_12555 [Acidobacteriota bacterium]|nr:hypothetical protein [Acidobacteriota bacterium]
MPRITPALAIIAGEVIVGAGSPPASTVVLRDRQRFVERDRATRDPLGQIVAFDQLHHERADAAIFFETVNLRDVRMVQRREGPGFARETRQPVGVACEQLG